MGSKERYERNRILTEEEQQLLAGKRVAVIGCGGLGGYVIEELGRLGVGYLVVCDGDAFDVSNLNRQLLATEECIGQSKAETAARRMREVNSEIEVAVKNCYIDEENGPEILKGCDAVVDALDSPGVKLMLQKLCKEQGIPLVHGAIGGWFGQVTTVFPGDDTLSEIYQKDRSICIDEGNPSFTPAVVASIEAAETVKLLLGKGELLRRRLLMIDLLHGDFESVEM